MKFYDVDWWQYCGAADDYIDLNEKVKAISQTHAIKKIKSKYPRAKNFKANLI
tara:strand:- start:5445 stop:5603 length:159 start_codon:yes stop_codon:yes gene_type:complete